MLADDGVRVWLCVLPYFFLFAFYFPFAACVDVVRVCMGVPCSGVCERVRFFCRFGARPWCRLHWLATQETGHRAARNSCIHILSALMQGGSFGSNSKIQQQRQ